MKIFSPCRAALLASIALALFASGCLWNSAPVASEIERVQKGERNALRNEMPERPDVITHNSGPYLLGAQVKLSEPPLPTFFDTDVTLVSERPMRLTEAAARISSMIGVPLHVSASAERVLAGAGAAAAGGAAGGRTESMIGGPQGTFLPSPQFLSSLGSASGSPAGTVKLNWKGPLKGLLDQVASDYGVFWEWDAGAQEINFFYTKTQTFKVAALAGQNQIQASVSNAGFNGSIGAAGAGGMGASPMGGAGGGAPPVGGGVAGGMAGGAGMGGGAGTPGSSGESSQTVNTNTNLDLYSDIECAVQTIINQGQAGQSGGGASGSGSGGSGNGSRGCSSTNSNSGFSVTVSPSLAQVTVTATPPVLRQVAEYFEDLNVRLSQQVLVSVRVYSVTLTREQNVGLDLAEAMKFAAGSLGINVSSVSLPAAVTGLTVGSAGAVVLSGATGAARQYAGSQALFNALATMGDVTMVTSGQVLALNNQPAPLQVGNEITYLAENFTSATLGATFGGLIPGEVTTGFSANFLPLILPGRRVMLQYSINLSQLQSLQTISSNDQSIQAPNVATQNFQQRAMLHDGDTLVLSGFEQVNNQRNVTGGLWPWLWSLTGGGADWYRQRQVLVIAIHVKLV